MGFAAFMAALVLHATAVQHQQAALRQPVWPAQGTITAPFGHDGARPHPGIDIGMLRSLDVRAAVAGRVLLVGQPTGYEGYGNIVVVRSSSDLTEIYAHLAQVEAQVGERVLPGKEIGIAGCTGFCTGTHLHFEVRRDDVPVSPLATVLRPLEQPTRALTSATYAFEELPPLVIPAFKPLP
jgi:murein DD-endopeptidase MepM/ murein hydrolase activator NlpD